MYGVISFIVTVLDLTAEIDSAAQFNMFYSQCSALRIKLYEGKHFDRISGIRYDK